MQTLAHHLERRSDFSRGTQIALDEVWKLAGTRRCLALHPLVVGLVAGLVGLPVGLMVGVMVVLWPGLAVGLWVVPVSGLLAGLVVGLQCAYAVGLVVGINELQARIGGNLTKRAKWLAWRIPGAASKPGAPQRFAWRVPGRSRWRRGLAVGLASGLAFLLGSLVASGFTSSWLLFGVVAGLILAIINGLRAGLGTTPEERLALGQDARRVIHDDLVVGLVFGLLVLGVCLVLGALLGLALERAHGLHYPLAMGLLVGLVVGMVFGVTFGLSSAVVSGRHATASLLFGFTGIFPRRPAQFLRAGPQRRAPACDRYRLPVPPRHLPAMAHRRRR